MSIINFQTSWAFVGRLVGCIASNFFGFFFLSAFLSVLLQCSVGRQEQCGAGSGMGQCWKEIMIRSRDAFGHHLYDLDLPFSLYIGTLFSSFPLRKQNFKDVAYVSGLHLVYLCMYIYMYTYMYI